MEGAGEMTGTVDDNVEGLHLGKKETESSPQENNFKVLDSSTGFISAENEWRDPLPSLRSPEVFTDTVEGKILVGFAGSNIGPENPCNVNDTDVMVEELTLANYKSAQVSTVGCSTEEIPKRRSQGQWHHLFQLAGVDVNGRSRMDLMSKEQLMFDSEEAAKFMPTPKLGAESTLPLKNLNKEHAEASRNLINSSKGDFMASAQGVSGGIRSKVLPASGFPQFFVKNTLKGKGTLYAHPGARQASRVTIKSQTSERETKGAVPPIDVSRASRASAKAIPLSAVGGAASVETFVDGLSLRECLKPGCQKINKIDSIYIFTQIVELMDLIHSQGVVMQDIRPSSFLILPSNRVKYVGPQMKMEFSEKVTNRDSQYLERQSKKKRSMEHGISTNSARHRRVCEHTIIVGQHSHFSSGYGLDRETLTEDDASDSKTWNSGRDSRNPWSLVGGIKTQNLCTGLDPSSIVKPSKSSSESVLLEERWYSSPEELAGGACTLSSNIYSLGVLLFELFCYFELPDVHLAAMTDLRHRILPPSFLSENPKEAGFCLWLLHPEPSSRPRTMEILQSDLISEARNVSSVDQVSSSVDDEDAESELLLHFLVTLKEQKQKQASKLVEDLGCINVDIHEVERRHSQRTECLSKIHESSNDVSNGCCYKDPSLSSRSKISQMNEDRLMRNISQLEDAYFLMRSKIGFPEADGEAHMDRELLGNPDKRFQVHNGHESDCKNTKSADRLGAFFEGICKFARYNKFEVKGTLRNGDLLNSANVICSLSFDRDEDYFAAAGVSKKIKIFEFQSLLNDMVDIHYPVIEMSSKSKLSCVCWNSYIKNYLVSTDYDGIVQLWDANTGHGFMQFREHQKRAWSLDFSQVDPTKLASGSDDCTVKLWNINEENSISSIGNVANVCCVQFSPHSTHLLAFGSADYKIYCYDLRNTRTPWCTLMGHGKAVSYVKFLDSETLVSASTDNTLKLWDLNKTTSGLSTSACTLTLTGHTNEKNFVGLSVSDGYIACGSETNEVYAFHRSLPMPITCHKFGSVDPISGQETGDDNGQFVSSVCWRGKSNMVVAANSSGSIKLLQLV